MTRRDGAGPRGWPLVHEAVAAHGRARPGALAVDDGVQRRTYGQLVAELPALSAGLGALAGERIGLLLGNSIAHLELLLAAPAAGLTVSPLHDQWPDERLTRAVRALGLEAMVTDDPGRERLERLRLDIPVRTLEQLRVADAEAHAPPTGPDPEAWHLLAPSGGTSGRLKAVAISHRATAARALAQLVEFGGRAGETFVATTPLFHGAARGSALSHLAAGGSVRLRPDFDADRFTVDVEGATSTFCVPTMLTRLLEADIGPVDPRLRILVSGASLAPELARAVRKRLGCGLDDYYASVDAGGLAVGATGTADSATSGISFVGRLYFGTLLRLEDARDHDGARLGRLVAEGPSIASATIHEDGQLESIEGGVRTGDLGALDDAGRLTLHGRADDVIISGGVNVAPAAVEAALRDHEDVIDCIVAGVPDPRWGEVVGAVLRTRRPGAADAVIAWARERLPGPERPRLTCEAAELPTTPLGKPDRNEARRRLQEAAHAD